MNYFNHHYASNSDIKKIVNRSKSIQEMDGLDMIFAFGTEFHAGILEPHKADFSKITVEQKELIEEMKKTFWRDQMCRDIVSMPDFRREHEYYRSNRYGLQGVRCKVDGESKSLRTILELKGLAVTTEKAFKESLLHMNYDQGATWYIDTVSGVIRYRQKLVVGISKKNPDKLFKMLIDRNHPYYRSGQAKVENGVKIWKQWGFK